MTCEKIKCKDKNSVEQEFIVKTEVIEGGNDSKILFQAYKEQADINDSSYEAFTLMLIEINKQLFVSIITHSENTDFINNGVSDGMILFASRKTKTRIYSSTNKINQKKSTFEFIDNRNDKAEKVWKRLVEKGAAKYSFRTDRYYTIKFVD